MSEIPRFPLMSAFGGRVEVSPVGIDELSNVRALERSSFSHFHAALTSEAELEAFNDWIVSPQHMESLVDDIANDALHGARLDGRLIGVVGWGGVSGPDSSVRLHLLYIDHFFAKNGVGRFLLQYFERRARMADAQALSVKTLVSSVGFFEADGHELTSYGSHKLSAKESLSVAFLRKVLR
ncbi:MAG: GNAT family N-acetyltransferase [Pseudomonadota bacterium]